MPSVTDAEYFIDTNPGVTGFTISIKHPGILINQTFCATFLVVHQQSRSFIGHKNQGCYWNWSFISNGYNHRRRFAAFELAIIFRH